MLRQMISSYRMKRLERFEKLRPFSTTTSNGTSSNPPCNNNTAKWNAKPINGINLPTNVPQIRFKRPFGVVAYEPTTVSRNKINRIQSTSQDEIVQFMLQHIEKGEENAFYVVNTKAVEARLDLWKKYLPNVHPFYAVKCNPDPAILQTLAKLGCGFDCASRAEIEQILKLNVDPSLIIYANPCKQPSHIDYAKQQQVDLMTFDSVDELTKIKKVNPEAKLVLRILVDDSKSQCQLGTKFGATMIDVPKILAHAKNLKLNVIGISFHVGSGCYSVSAFSDAVKRANKAFEIGKTFGFQFNLLDIGGGFPGDGNGPITFEEIAITLRDALNQYFPAERNVQIISEPGRFFAASSHTLAVNIIGRKIAPNLDSNNSTLNATNQKVIKGVRKMHAVSQPKFMYFVNDGLYGSFNCLLYDHATVTPVPLAKSPPATFSSSIWGPTCDGLDCIVKDVDMPKLEVGEWMYFSNMGAYTSAAGSHFNGFAPPQKIYFDD